MTSLRKFGTNLIALLICWSFASTGFAFQPPEPIEVIEPWPLENVQLLADLKPVPVDGGHSSHHSPAVGDSKVVWSTPPEKTGTTDKRFYDYVIKRLTEFHARELQNNKKPAAKPDFKNKVLVSLEDPVFASYNETIEDPAVKGATRKEIRQFFGAQIWVLNNTDEPVKVNLDEAELEIEGVKHEPAKKISPISFQYYLKGRSKSSSQLKIHSHLEVKPQAVASSWIFFSKLEDTVENPSLKLQVPCEGEKNIEIDINQFSQNSLKMDSSLMGPYNCLSVVKVAGETNSISMPILIEKLSELSNNKIARVVIQWEESSREMSFPRVSGSTYIYSRRAAPQGFAQIGSTVSLPQMHVVFPKSWRLKPSTTSHSSRLQEFKVDVSHKSLEDAVAAALQTAFEILPADKVIEELEQGHPLSQRAALLHGSRQIPQDDISLVLEFLDHKDVSMKSAALVALGQMGNEDAVSTLVKYAKGDDKSLSYVAVDSLAKSSHVFAHTELVKLLANASEDLKHEIINVFSEHPKGIWSEPLENLVLNEEDPKLRASSIISLGKVGSSNLLPILTKYLNAEVNSIVRDSALKVLMDQPDQESQKVALDFTVAYLEKSPPTSNMTSLLAKVPDERAIVLLLKHFKSGSISDSRLQQVVALLTNQGDQQILEEVSQQFDSMPNKSKYELLKALAARMPNLFQELASKVVTGKYDSKDSSFYRQVCTLLRQKPDEENARILMRALPDPSDKKANTRQVSTITSALSMMPSGLVARKALRKLRDEAVVPSIANYAGNAVRSLESSRSPARDGINHARAKINAKQYDEALKTLDLCEEIDPEVSTLYFERFRALSGKKQFKTAIEEISVALSFDPKNTTWLIYKARLLMEMRQFKDAAKEYDQIIVLNPSEANYYASRAHAYSMAQMFIEAEADFKKSAKLNPSHPDAITGVALMQAVNGKFGEATTTLSKNRKALKNSSMFAYNAACVYGRIIDYMEKHPETLDDKKRKEYQGKAIEELIRSAELGYRDWDWMKKDPDLKSISHLPEFKKIPEMDFSKPEPKPKSETTPKDKIQGVGAIQKERVFVFGGIPVLR